MWVFMKLCLSIIRRNRGFTAGLFIMSVLSVVVIFLGSNFGNSSTDTVEKFIADSNTPGAFFRTENLSHEDNLQELEAIDGVSLVASRLAFDTNIELQNNELFSVRVIISDPDGPLKNIVLESADQTDPDLVPVLFPQRFAKHNGISAGDTLKILSPFGDIDVFVRAIVTSPEATSSNKDVMSSYEKYIFTYVYADRDAFYEKFMPLDRVNEWLVYFDDGLSADEEKDIISRIEEYFGESLVSGTYTAESGVVSTIKSTVSTINVLCSFMPGIIGLIGLGFSFIFIKIIIENQRKMIGLLRALGFSKARVVSLFVFYTVVINIAALVAGIPIGYLLLSECIKVVAAAQGMTETVLSISFGNTAAMLFVIFAIGILASVLSSKTISSVDPSEAYGGVIQSQPEPPEFISRIKTDAFLTISIVSVFRAYKRQIIGAFCIAACIVSMCVGFGGVYSIGYPIDAVYGGRYRYDLAIRYLSGNDYERITEEVTGIERIEPVTLFTAEMLGGNKKFSTVTDGSEMIVLTDAKGNRIYPDEGVIIDEMCAKINGIKTGDTVLADGHELRVDGIAREILYTIMYIKPETAVRLGHTETNGVFIRLLPESDIKDIKKQISEIEPNAYFVDFATQKEQIANGFVPMRVVMFLFSVLAFLIGSILIFNMTVIDFNEKKVKYATLRALGTPVKRFGTVSAMENLSRVAVGIILSCPLSLICSNILFDLLSNASQQFVPVRYTFCFAMSCLIPLLYVLFGMAVTLRKIKKMNFIDYLNEVE